MKDFIMKTVGGFAKMAGNTARNILRFLIAIAAITAGCLLFLCMIFIAMVLG